MTNGRADAAAKRRGKVILWTVIVLGLGGLTARFAHDRERAAAARSLPPRRTDWPASIWVRETPVIGRADGTPGAAPTYSTANDPVPRATPDGPPLEVEDVKFIWVAITSHDGTVDADVMATIYLSAEESDLREKYLHEIAPRTGARYSRSGRETGAPATVVEGATRYDRHFQAATEQEEEQQLEKLRADARAGK